MTLKKSALFKNTILDYLIGYSKSTLGNRDFEINTSVGILEFTIYDNWVACVFADIKAASKRLYSVNEFSGKWNHHFNFKKPSAHDPYESGLQVCQQIMALVN